MALVANPVARAQKAKTRLQAARLKEELEVELALNDNTPAGWDAQADEALSILHARFGELTEDDWTHSNSKWSPSLSHHAKKGLHDRTDVPGEQEDLRNDDEDEQRGDEDARRRIYDRARPHLQRARKAGRRAYRKSGIPTAASNATGTALTYIGAAVGLSLLYLFLRDAEHPSSGTGRRGAFVTAADAFAYAVTALVSPHYDLLPGNNTTPATPKPPSPGAQAAVQSATATWIARRPGSMRTPSTPPRRPVHTTP